MIQQFHTWVHAKENENTNLKRYTHTHTHIQSNVCKCPKCLSTDVWVRKIWYIYTMEYYFTKE